MCKGTGIGKSLARLTIESRAGHNEQRGEWKWNGFGEGSRRQLFKASWTVVSFPFLSCAKRIFLLFNAYLLLSFIQ